MVLDNEISKSKKQNVRMYMSKKFNRNKLNCFEMTRIMQQIGINGHCQENLSVQCDTSHCWREHGLSTLLENVEKKEVDRLFHTAKNRLGEGLIDCAYIEKCAEGSCIYFGFIDQ